MPIHILDVIIIGVIIGFGLFGMWFGIISTIGSLVGTVAGVYLATRFYGPMANWLMGITHWTGNFPKVVMFFVAFLLINRMVGFVFNLLSSLLNIFNELKVINFLNKALGFIFGVLEGIIILGITLYFVNKFPFWGWLSEQIKISFIAPFLVDITSILWPLIPDELHQLQNYLRPWG